MEMGKNNLITLRLGTSNAYLFRGDNGYMLIDAGNPKLSFLFKRYLREYNISPHEIKLIVLTHVHLDHVGGLADIREICHPEILVHNEEAQLLENGKVVCPDGTNKFSVIISSIGKAAANFVSFKPIRPDIVITSDCSLKKYGFNARIIHTPGHTKGSLSVLLDTGEAAVGDTCVNYLPTKQIFPPYANDEEGVLNSWEKIVGLGAKKIYPSHGSSFEIDVIKNALLRLRKKVKS